jgi:hypothetical protein
MLCYLARASQNMESVPDRHQDSNQARRITMVAASQRNYETFSGCATGGLTLGRKSLLFEPGRLEEVSAADDINRKTKLGEYLLFFICICLLQTEHCRLCGYISWAWACFVAV